MDAFEGGELDVHTSDGDIIVDRHDGSRAEIRTSDGDIVLRSVRAPIDVSSGDGDITVTAPADLAADVYLEGEDLSVAEGLELLGRIRSHSVQGTLNGGGPNLELRTGDGAITLRQGN